MLRNQLLRAWGFTVVTVSYHEWERAGTAQGKRRHVGELLERATRAREEEDWTDEFTRGDAFDGARKIIDEKKSANN